LGDTGADGRVILKWISHIYTLTGTGCVCLEWGPVAVIVNTVLNLGVP